MSEEVETLRKIWEEERDKLIAFVEKVKVRGDPLTNDEMDWYLDEHSRVNGLETKWMRAWIEETKKVLAMSERSN